MKIVARVKLMPEADQAAALRSTLRTVNEAACRVSAVAFERGVPREYELREHSYAELKARGLGAQAAQHVIRKTRDAYTALKANIRAGNLGGPGSKRRVRAESKPVAFRPEAAQPYDDRCLSWQYDQRTVSIWTTGGRLKNLRFACAPDALKMLPEHRKGESDLIERDGVFYLTAVYDIPEPRELNSVNYGGRMGKRWGTWGLCGALLSLLSATGCELPLPEQGFQVRHEKPVAADAESARLLTQWRFDQMAADQLNAYVDLPYRVTVVGLSCEGEGTAYDSRTHRIELCYDDLTQVRDLFRRAGAGAGRTEEEVLGDLVRETLFHEAGHALIDALDLPDQGDRAEEDAADDFARLMLLDQGASGEEALLTAATGYDLEAAEDPDPDPDQQDVHAPDAERAEAHRCAVYAASPARHEALATEPRATCPATWTRTRDTWTRDLAPLLRHSP
ncbi:DUF4344 domain-containing metallopeptidase [Streptomyces sp. NPDC051183]|uniref:DUF4344 domain-containing metallopeptidase n=1 Tax=Streptomyces sp. NPDC051183 TaxID=3155165 RepID=UPI0034471DD7